MRRFKFWLPILLLGTALVIAVLASPRLVDRSRRGPPVSLDPTTLPADGNSSALLTIGAPPTERPRVSIDGPRGARLEELTPNGDRWEARVRTGVQPGRIRVAASTPGTLPSFALLTTSLASGDSLEDGTPDFLRLDDEHDRQSFRRWFTFLAEAQYFQAPAARPAEINDCAALIRYSYREALHVHDNAWAAAARLPIVPALDSVAKYQYPYTPLDAAIFRVRTGPFRASDLSDGAFAQFADAQTLWRWNCHFVSRGIAAARPGDLLFFHQDSGDERFHSMIYLGESQIRKAGQRYFVYHTGPRAGDPGEIRRLSVEELTRFPQPEWRPLTTNPNFLGVYRWNILCPVGTN